MKIRKNIQDWFNREIIVFFHVKKMLFIKFWKTKRNKWTKIFIKKVNYQVESLIKNKKTGFQDINLKRNINKTMELGYSRRYNFFSWNFYLFQLIFPFHIIDLKPGCVSYFVSNNWLKILKHQVYFLTYIYIYIYIYIKLYYSKVRRS